MKMFRSIAWWFAALGLVTSSIAAAGGYRVLKRIPIAGDTGWDYITADSQTRRLYVPHGVEVVVLDLDSGEIIGKITGQRGLHGVAVAPEFGRGFISATDPGSVTIFDLKTLAVIDKIRVGDDPNGIIYDPETHRVFSADRGSKRMTAIDAKTGKIVAATEDLAGRTEHLAADGSGHVFLNMQDTGKLLKLDAQTLKIMETWSTAPCAQPSSMDMDRAHQRIFIGCRSERPLLTVIDAKSGKIVATQPIGPGVDALEFDPKTSLIYVSTGGDGMLSVLHEDSTDKYSLVENVKTLPGARTLALDHKTGKVYLPVADMGPVPEPTPENPRPRARMLPGTFSVLMIGR
jgi:DNA-binding beta-propeller fold protein YncE